MNIVQARFELLRKKKKTSSLAHALVADGGPGGAASGGAPVRSEVEKVAVEAEGVTRTATAVAARRVAKEALPPEPRSSRPRAGVL